MTTRKPYQTSPMVPPVPGIVVARTPSFLSAQSVASGELPGAARATSVSTKHKKAPYSLDHLLAGFDPEKHGGEVMAFEPIGKEKF